MEKLFGIPVDSLATVLLVSVGFMLATLAILGWRQRVMLRLGLRNIGRRRAQTAFVIQFLMVTNNYDIGLNHRSNICFSFIAFR